MGIPRLFSEIVRKHPDCHFWDDEFPVDHLFLDFNAMIYNVALTVDDEDDTVSSYENKLIPKIIEYIIHVLNIIKPKRTFYIAIDGSVPLGKLRQQRSRRFRSVLEYMYKKELEKKYKTVLKNRKWSTVSISPGTVFMAKLCREISKAIDKRIISCPKIIFSDFHIAGEGESKIINYLRENKPLANENTVIYSPDADMIVLSIMTHIPNIYILRNPVDKEIVEKYDEFLYLNIDKCRENFYKEISNEYDTTYNIDPNKILEDYTFLMSFCGNDFVVGSLFLGIKDKGLETLIKIYKKTKTDDYLVSNSEINFPFFKKIIHELMLIEEEYLQKWQKNRDRIRRGATIEQNDQSTTDELIKQEMNLISHSLYFDPKHPHFEKYNHLFNKINYFDPKWNEQYNKYFFKVDSDIVCYDYIKSLVFCLRYYNGLNKDYLWSYTHRASPTFKDLDTYLNKKDLNISLCLSLNISFDLNEPLKPFEQLMMILPKQYLYLLPKTVSEKMPEKMKEFYPKNFDVDVVKGQKFIYSEVILDEAPLEIIKDYLGSLSFTNMENDRNRIEINPYIYQNNKLS